MGRATIGSNRGGIYDLYMTHPRWETPVRLTTQANATSHIWSPDGDTVVFASSGVGGAEK